MRILATSDLNVNQARHQAGLESLCAAIGASRADVLVVAGDFAAGAFDADYARWLPRLDFPGPKLAVPGNHDVWQREGPTWDRYRAFCAHLRDQGWHVLDHEPFRWRGVSFVGNMGWYDYSFFPAATPARDALARAAAERVRAPIAGWDDLRRFLPTRRLPRVCRWNDARFTDWGQSDPEVAQHFHARLANDLDRAARLGDRIVAVVHHVPFAELVPVREDLRWSFARAFAGSGRMGDLLRATPGVALALCGHVHRRAQVRLGDLDAWSVAFTPGHPEPVELHVG